MDFNMDSWVKSIEERYKKERTIFCPFCGKEQENDDCQYPISYHGSEDGPEEFECQDCEKTFYVREDVARKWFEGKTQEEAQDRHSK